MRILVLLIVPLICLAGCGKRGPLYLPDSPPSDPAKQTPHQTSERR